MLKNTIKLKKYSDVIEEFEANAAITPGMLIEVMSTNKVRAHASAGRECLPMFALEDELQGKGIDENYAAADRVLCWIPNRGDVVYALLKDGENIAIGDFLESAGNGSLQKYVADVDSSKNVTPEYQNMIIGQAVEAIDLSGSSGTHPASGYRIAVRII